VLHTQNLPSHPAPRHYIDSSLKLDEIKVSVVYFVPKNKISFFNEELFNSARRSLEKLRAFHLIQFDSRSQLSFEIFPETVAGQSDSLDYDSEFTQHGNPHAISRVTEELESRFEFVRNIRNNSGLSSAGGRQVYQVLLIIYEGVGASGSENVALISRKFLTELQFTENGASVLAHEFYHTLGIPDAYDLDSGYAQSEDLMGRGRDRSLDRTYLDAVILRRMGI